MRIAEGVYTDDRVRAIVFLVLVVKGLFLNLAALVTKFHRSQHTAALGDRFKFLEHSLFNQFGQFFDDKTALVGVLVLCQTPFAIDDELDRHGAAYALFRRCGNRFIVGVGVQRVGIVVSGDQRLQGGADVVEVDFLRMQRAPRSLTVVLEFL